MNACVGANMSSRLTCLCINERTKRLKGKNLSGKENFNFETDVNFYPKWQQRSCWSKKLAQKEFPSLFVVNQKVLWTLLLCLILPSWHLLTESQQWKQQNNGKSKQ